MSPTILWLIAGAIFIGVEIFGIPGVGFLFAGIAALLVGGAVEVGILASDATLIQFIVFFVFTCISAALLLKKTRRDPKPDFNNIVGTEARVAAPGLSGGQEGQVKWSGTLMRAKIDPASGIDVMPEDMAVTITRTEGNLVYVTHKH